jgi:hypothetical protein
MMKRITLLFTKVIQDNGYQVTGFTNPLFILDYISEYPDRVDLIIVDYRYLNAGMRDI